MKQPDSQLVYDYIKEWEKWLENHKLDFERFQGDTGALNLAKFPLGKLRKLWEVEDEEQEIKGLLYGDK